MKPTKLDQRFLESTRGRIVTLLRGSPRTVKELATGLELTDNAVRAHLTTLERDGLVQVATLRARHYPFVRPLVLPLPTLLTGCRRADERARTRRRSIDCLPLGTALRPGAQQAHQASLEDERHLIPCR